MQRQSLIFVVILVLVVAFVYSSFTPFIVFAVPPDDRWGGPAAGSTCTDVTDKQGITTSKCCWRERIPGSILGVEYCQTCTQKGTSWDCKPKEKQAMTPPTAGENIVPGDTGVLEQPPTSQPLGPFAPLQGGVLEQPPSEGGVTQRGCQSNVRTTCLPCDLGLPGASCIPASEWPPNIGQLEQGEGAAPGFVPGFLERQQLQPPPADQGAAELAPPATEESQPATVEEEPVPPCPEGQVLNEQTGLCVPEDCPEGQVLDERSGICVLEEPEAAEEEPGQPEPEEQSSGQEEQPLAEDENSN